MKQIIHNQYLLQEVPEGQMYFVIFSNEFRQEIRYNKMVSPGKFKAVPIQLPPGNWQIVARASEITEEQAKGIVERFKSSWGTFYYPEYPLEKTQGARRTKPGYDTAIESLHSLIRSHGMEVNECLILKKD